MNENEALALVTRRLQPGEKLVWCAVPLPLRAALAPFSSLAYMTLWTGIVLCSLPAGLLSLTALFDYGRQGRGYGYAAGLYGIQNPARAEALIYETLLHDNAKGAAK